MHKTVESAYSLTVTDEMYCQKHTKENEMKHTLIIHFGRLKSRIKSLTKMIRNDRVGVYAAETAFFIVLSVVPFLMLTVTAASYIIDGNIGDYLSLVATNIPGVLGEYIESEFLTLAKRPMRISFSAVAAFWSASKGVRATRRGVRSVYGESADSFFSESLAGLVFTAVFIVLIIAVLVFLVFGDALATLLGGLLPSLHSVFDLTVTFSPVLFAVLLALFFALILRTFTPASAGMKAYSQHLPGAVLAAVGWILYSYIFSLFISEFSSMPTLYGSLGAIMVLMIWFYMIMYIFLIGAEFNKYLYSRKRKA